MKVLLKEDVDNLGYTGEVMTVADGYGRNYLIPQGLAVKATASVLKEAEAWRERAAVRMVELRKEHEALANRIDETSLDFIARAGETGKLYGSITTADVIDQLNEALGTDLERKSVVGGPLRQLGEHKVIIRLSRDFQPQVTVNINQFEEEEEEEVEEPEAEETEAQSEDEMEEVAEVTDDQQGEIEVEESVDEEEPEAAEEEVVEEED
jgi:large subunit ribosomal protein L9